MNLISVMKLVPIRNEKGVVYKWDEERMFVNPTTVLRATYRDALKKVVLSMVNGEEIIIEDSLERFAEKFEEGTSV